MFIVIQFPIADIRNFLECDTYKLNSPCLPFVNPYRNEFIRCFGPLRNRFNQEDVRYDETVYGRANRALRIPNLGSYRLGRKYNGFIPTCVFRRFFANNETCKVEIGFKNIENFRFLLSSLNDDEFLNLLMELLDISALIPPVGDNARLHKLKDTGEKLSSLYLHATTKYPLPAGKQPEKFWVQAGNPMILVEYNKYEIKKLPGTVRKVTTLGQASVSLHHTMIYSKNNNSKIRVWLIGKGGGNSRGLVRKLRLNLLRLNAEQECLKQVLRSIEQGKIVADHSGEASDRLQDYINSAIRNISQQERYGLPHNEIVEVANSYENIINQNEREFLLSRLEKIRKNIYKKVENYTLPKQLSAQQIIIADRVTTLNGTKNIFTEGQFIQEGGDTVTKVSVNIGNGNTFNGNVAIAGTIQNSFNTADNFKPENEREEKLKEKLKELNTMIAKLCEQLPEDQSKQAADDLEAFTKETTSKKPRKKWYELAAEGLIEAAAACGALAGPVTNTVKEIISFIGSIV